MGMDSTHGYLIAPKAESADVNLGLLCARREI